MAKIIDKFMSGQIYHNKHGISIDKIYQMKY